MALDGKAPIVGRQRELAQVRAFLSTPGRARTLVIGGEPGIGKTTVWEAAIELARELGWRVLSARPSAAEAQPSFAALIELCEAIGARTLSALPAPQRLALDVALLRTRPTDMAPDPHAVALGFLNAVRALTADGPVLIAVDDLPWADPPSAEVLAFAAPRIEHEPIGFVLARRPGAPSGLERVLERTPPERLDVGGLDVGDVRRLLSEGLGLSLPRQLLRRVVASTLGNPLFVLEVGRAVIERGGLRIGDELPVPDAVEQLLGTRVARLSPALRGVLLAVALNADLRISELAAVSGAAAVDDAIHERLLVLRGDRVRPWHPLLAAAAIQHAGARERRALHLALASHVEGAEVQALHLALATQGVDAALAEIVGAAAAGAAARGARRQAVRLGEHAVRLTPAGAPERAERVLALATYLETAGEPQRVTELLTPELVALPRGRLRARAWVLLSEGGSVRSTAQYERYLDRALDECGDDAGLRACALAKKSVSTSLGSVERIREAEAWASAALADASGPDVQRLALDALSWARSLRGQPIDDLCERFRAGPEAALYVAESPERAAAQRWLWRGELARARATLQRLRALADERGEPVAYALMRLHLCELELRAGDWETATALLDEWAEDSDRKLLVAPMYERCRALLAAGRGLADEAKQWSTSAIAQARTTGIRWDALEALRARGTVELLTGEPARACEPLRRVWRHTQREGVEEPGAFPVAPELVEALVDVGEIDEARSVVAHLRALSERQHHPWGRASVKRCSAMIALAHDRESRDAAAGLQEAADEYGRLGLRFDRARTCSPSAACNAAAASGPARATPSNGRPPSSTRWARRAGPSWRAQSSSASELAGPEPAAN